MPMLTRSIARTLFNKAITLSAMRRMMMQPMSIDIPDVPQPEQIPPVTARILLGGKADSYAGFLPGIFEEALVTLQWERPVYILGGFGGAAEILANAMLASGNDRPQELTLDWHKERNPALVTLLDSARQFTAPANLGGMENSLDALFAFVLRARADLSGTLRTGLSDQETRELLKTSNIANAVHLVRAGLVTAQKSAVVAGVICPGGAARRAPSKGRQPYTRGSRRLGGIKSVSEGYALAKPATTLFTR